LLALCQRHHRLHHLGRLGIRGDADDPDGVVFTDERGRQMDGRGRVVPAGRLFEQAAARLGIPAGAWSHPTGERFDPFSVCFDERAG
jgi:hypothetical protein